MPWRVLLTPPLSGAENMALDEALVERARRTGESVLRVYTWARPTVSFGRNQTARGAYDPARLCEAGVDVVRRPTGGRAILHDREVTYSVTAPAGDEPLRTSYGRINRLLVHGLRSLGVCAEVVEHDAGGSGSRAPGPGTAPCFEVPTEGEIVLGGRKLVGSAQWRDGGALLQHGSILLDDDQSRLASLASVPLPPVPPPATLRSALGRAPSPEEVLGAMRAAVESLEDPAAATLEVDAELAALAAGAGQRYGQVDWTWRL
jgi:lipoate-protein ligase A